MARLADFGFGGERCDPLAIQDSFLIPLLHPAYIAGLIDGEGSFVIYPRVSVSTGHPSYRGEISIGMTNRDPLDALVEGVGGHISFHERQNPGWKPVYAWKLGDPQRILSLLGAISPYLYVKRGQARTMMLFCKARLSKPRTAKVTDEMTDFFEHLCSELTILNRKGTDA